MGHTQVTAGCILLAAITFWAGCGPAVAQDTDCPALIEELKQKRRQLADHVEALKRLNEQDELTIMGVLNHKIGELIREVSALKASMMDCGAYEKKPAAVGMEAVKSDKSEYATMSCDQLRKQLLQIIPRMLALKRREASMFSPLSPSEKTDLQETEQMAKDIRNVLEARCPSPDEPAPSRSRRRY